MRFVSIIIEYSRIANTTCITYIYTIHICYYSYTLSFRCKIEIKSIISLNVNNTLTMLPFLHPNKKFKAVDTD